MSKKKVNELKPIEGSVRTRTRKGRGNASGFGGECGRGHKGQKSRSGYSRKIGFEGGQMPLYRRIPKKRGFRNPFKIYYHAINLSLISELFKDGETVDLETLREKGILSPHELFKVLGNGELKKKVTIKAHKISESASEKAKKAGATVELITAASA